MVPFGGVGDDGVVAEHPLACEVGSNSVKKFLFRAAVSDKISPRYLGPGLLVGRGSSSYLNGGVVVALDGFVRRGSVLFLLSPVALSEVMPSVVKVRSSVTDPLNVGAASVEVEDGGVSLPSSCKADNGVKVTALVGMLLLDDLAEDGGELEQEIRASGCSEVMGLDLRPG